MDNLDLFEPLPKGLIRRVDLALAVLKDGPELGLFDGLALAIRAGDRTMIFDLSCQTGQDTLAVLEKATIELRKMLGPRH